MPRTREEAREQREIVEHAEPEAVAEPVKNRCPQCDSSKLEETKTTQTIRCSACGFYQTIVIGKKQRD